MIESEEIKVKSVTFGLDIDLLEATTTTTTTNIEKVGIRECLLGSASYVDHLRILVV